MAKGKLMKKVDVGAKFLTVVGGVHIITVGFGVLDVASFLSFGMNWLQNTLYVAVGGSGFYVGLKSLFK